MKRRAFVVGIGAALAGAPWLIRRAFGDVSVHASVGVAAAMDRARKSGRPIFAIVIPPDDDAKDERGRVWGEFLNHATPAELAPLGLADVVCAPLRDLPATVGAGDETFALVIEPSGKSTPLAARVPAYDWRKRGDFEATAKKRIGIVAALVQRGLGAREPSPSPARARELAALVQARVVKGPPPGAHWANAGGCGLDTVEDMQETEAIGIGCGMGSLPAESRRFLYFFSQTPGQRWVERDRRYEEEQKRKK